MIKRASRPELFMQVARLFGEQSTCNRGSVGAVIVREGRIVSTGYVGSPPGQPHCTDVGCEPVPMVSAFGIDDHDRRLKDFGCQRTIHAEANALLWAARAGVRTDGAVMYTTSSPCVKCAHAIIAAGIVAVTYDQKYRIPEGIDLLHAANVSCASLAWRRQHG